MNAATSGVSREDAETVLAAVCARYRAELDPASVPELADLVESGLIRPYAPPTLWEGTSPGSWEITWESGPDEWAMRWDGGHDEEFACEYAAELGHDAAVAAGRAGRFQSAPVVIPADVAARVSVEPIYSFSVGIWPAS